ncbi:MAG TPA: hypothetical protein VFL27_02195 [Candidatus Dormibacteraeota bacterium]|nr:hypothetical protein [Candidatus Dormibacteraeota bacterium]
MRSTTISSAPALSARVLKPAIVVARLVLFASAAALLVLGVIIWTGSGDQLIPLHVVVGSALVLALWVIAAMAFMAGVSRPLITLAVAWSVLVPIFGLTQDRLVEGDLHWTIQVLHLVVGMSLAAFGQGLILQIDRRQTASRLR